MKASLILFVIFSTLFSCTTNKGNNVGQTIITKWQGNKHSAISITYDDGIINQFTVARPIMNRLGLPATFYVITGKIEGSGEGKFIGRTPGEIIAETATVKTNAENFFERASYIAFSGTDEAVTYHSRAGSLFEAGKVAEAYELIDEGYEKLRKGELINTNAIIFHDNVEDTTTWADLRTYGEEGHEIASHTVTHPRLAVLDEANLLYELEQSKADIQQFMGERFTFSAECPYGTEDERVMKYAHALYPSLRNRMPAPYLEELNRSSQQQPGASTKEYVQWQRGPLTDVSMEVMKSWVDTCLAHDNIWLVLVFHGVDGLGWEPKTGEELEAYFHYIKSKEDNLWVATFADVTKYIRERKNTVVNSKVGKDKIQVSISSELDPVVYDVPVTLKTRVPAAWQTATLYPEHIKENPQLLPVQKGAIGSYVLYSVQPAGGDLFISEQK